jgi:hypothetical protein
MLLLKTTYSDRRVENTTCEAVENTGNGEEREAKRERDVEDVLRP